MFNLEVSPKRDLSSFRKIALGTWRTAFDPSVYGAMDLDVTEALEYIEKFRAHTGRRLTLTHLMAKAAGAVMQTMPDANALLRWGRIYLRKRIGVFFQVVLKDAVTGEVDLSGATVHDPETLGVLELMNAFDSQVKKVRKGEDKELESSRNLFKSLPWFMVRPILNLIGFLSYTLNLDLRFMGVPQDAFGTLMITNIGSLGLEEAYVPLVPYSHIPLLLAVGSVKATPTVVENDQGEQEIKIRQIMRVTATFDHRVLDGMHAAGMSKVLRQWIEHPFENFDDIDTLPKGEAAALPVAGAAAATSDQEEASPASATAEG